MEANEPRADRNVSNAPNILNVVLAERVSERSFNDFTTERIFDPLGVTSTLWRNDFT